MSEISERAKPDDVQELRDPQIDRVVPLPNRSRKRPRNYRGALLGAGALLLLAGGLGLGAFRHYQAGLALAADDKPVVPEVRVAAVRASDSKITVSLPATTTAFEAANIFARTSGYVEKRYVDIGDRVKAGALLADITAPELDHQIAQAQATLAQDQATLQQTQASRELAEVTNTRDSNLVQKGWLTLQQGDNDRLTLQAQQAAVGSGPVEYHRPTSPDSNIGTGEGLPARGGSIRRGHHPAQYRQWQPGAIRIDLHVHADAL